MTQLSPDYYHKFKCIADKCTITCCQEWKISVDPTTYENWKKLNSPQSLHEEYKTLSSYTMRKDKQRIIKLNSAQRCPFLSEDKLCHLVTSYGDAVLSDTCTTFPRETHTFSNHTEQMLMPCCPAVIDLWKDCPINFPSSYTVLNYSNDSLFLIRDKIITILQNDSIHFETCMLEIFYVLLELKKLSAVTPELIEEYFSAETLSQLQLAICDIAISPADSLYECNELLQDLSVNYQKEGLYDDFLSPLIHDAADFTLPSDNVIKVFMDKFLSYDTLIRNYLANECFSDLILPDCQLEHMLIQFQWLAIEYTAIRQSLFLYWLANGQNELPYDIVRRHIVIISRMTGYEADDIEEYLSNSFESLIWDWGYFALVIGKLPLLQ